MNGASIAVRLPVVAHVFLVRDDTVLLARRANTGFEDGNYGPVGGHLEPSDLEIIGVTHYTSLTGGGLDFFLRTSHWTGEPFTKTECDDLCWCTLDALPSNTVPFVRRALKHHLVNGVWFDESG